MLACELQECVKSWHNSDHFLGGLTEASRGLSFGECRVLQTGKYHKHEAVMSKGPESDEDHHFADCDVPRMEARAG